MPVQPVDLVPYWFTRLAHYWRRRKCARVGHESVPICTWCGYTPGWTAVIVGRESGNVTSLPFVDFLTYEDAGAWCIRMNDAHLRAEGGPSLTYYEPALKP